MNNNEYGIAGSVAPELSELNWIDGEGQEMPPIQLSNFKQKFIIIYCFQSWCPGCHSRGLPALQKMTESLQDNANVVFLAIQTVFEGKDQNTFEKLRDTQLKYNLKIPFAQDEGNIMTNNISSVMTHYRTGGTPWFIFIDQDKKVVFNDFHLNVDNAIEYLQEIN